MGDDKHLENLIKLRDLENEYFKKFNEYFPLYVSKEKEGVFGPTELYEMAIEAQVLLTSLDSTAIKRLNYVGFDLLFPFNNPVDWYYWKELIKTNNIHNTIYFSISTRVATEFKRIELHIKNASWDNYCKLSESEFSVSKETYSQLFLNSEEYSKITNNKQVDENITATHVANFNVNKFVYNEKNEEQAIKTLEGLQQTTGTWSNVANVLSVILKITGMK